MYFIVAGRAINFNHAGSSVSIYAWNKYIYKVYIEVEFTYCVQVEIRFEWRPNI